MIIGLTPEMVMAVAISKTGRKFSERQFKSMFGVSSKITTIAWNLMLSSSPEMVNKSNRVEDLLMTLHFKNDILVLMSGVRAQK